MPSANVISAWTCSAMKTTERWSVHPLSSHIFPNRLVIIRRNFSSHTTDGLASSLNGQGAVIDMVFPSTSFQ
jgi:hypothetical protein